MDHSAFMDQAIALSGQAIQTGMGGPFGAVIVQGEQIVAAAHNEVLATHDPTAHAEVLTIRRASRNLGKHVLDDCVIYTSCEPCPMCLGAIYWSRIKAIYFANSRDEAAAIGFDDAFFYEEMMRTMEQRHIPMIRACSAKAKKVFDDYLAMPSRQIY